MVSIRIFVVALPIALSSSLLAAPSLCFTEVVIPRRGLPARLTTKNRASIARTGTSAWRGGMRTTSSSSSCGFRMASLLNDSSNDNDNEEAADPDLLGVFVDGFPLPPTPVRDNDEELLAAIRRVPLSSSLDTPLEAGPVQSAFKHNTKTHDETDADVAETAPPSTRRPLRVIIAGGGLGGLSVATDLLSRGCDVHIFEQAKQYKPFGGPIQIQSNALWALREIHPTIFSAVSEAGVQTGDRLSGIKDGIRCVRDKEGWLVKFDAATPAIRRGLPLTLAINRVVLQDIFLKYGIPQERIHTASRVVAFENLGDDDDDDDDHSTHCGVCVELEDGTSVYGDILVGADGVWSRVRHQMLGLPKQEVGPKYATKHARYSGYTCFTGTCRHTPADIDEVAYKVFLGQKQYFGCTDAGHGWQHWWAFLPDPPGRAATHVQKGSDMLDRLEREFQDWSPEIHDLFHATKPEVVKQRDLFDRLPMTQGWTSGCTTLLGDSAHVTLPNLGQGGAMAIEDAYVLGQELEGIRHTNEISSRLQAYERRRFIRASIAQYLSRNGSDLLGDWDTMRNTPIVGPIAMWFINLFQPITMGYLYSASF